MKVYAYKNCSTCQKALRYLQERGLAFELFPIVEQPPSLEQLQRMSGYLGGFRGLFNTSGVQYRELGVAARLQAGMTEEEALELLAGNGKLIKRPFLLTESGGTVGFRQEVWDELLAPERE